MGRKSVNTSAGRDAFVVARNPLPRPTPALPVLQIEDRRQWHPERAYKQAAGSPRSATRPVVSSRRPASFFGYQTKAHLVFADPPKVSICARRSRRRQVLFAKQQVGRGKRGNIPKHRNAFSSIGCR
ncbi:MAG: hypothetical protein [Arizlama microvirus]|nr:MAG: hypothetical protein [Arizlama microvirus]